MHIRARIFCVKVVEIAYFTLIDCTSLDMFSESVWHSGTICDCLGERLPDTLHYQTLDGEILRHI